MAVTRHKQWTPPAGRERPMVDGYAVEQQSGDVWFLIDPDRDERQVGTLYRQLGTTWRGKGPRGGVLTMDIGEDDPEPHMTMARALIADY